MLRQLWRRLARRNSGNDNPLQRHVDRVESAIVAGFVVAFLIGAPLLSIVAAREAGAAATREQRAESGWRPATAVLQQSAAAGLVAEDGAYEASWVAATWTMPHGGGQRSGLVAVELNARSGQRIAIWVTQAGQLTHAPLTTAEVRQWEAMGAMLAPIGLALLLVVAGVAVRVVANRRRLAGWTRAWEVAGPRWSLLR